jgi:hypothetical protein
MEMAGFILDYGSENGECHVQIDMAQDQVTLWHGTGEPVKMTTAEFEECWPNLVEEMVRNGALRRK